MDIDVSGWQGPQESRPAKNSSLVKNANLAKNSSLAKNANLAKTPDLTKVPAALLFVATDLLARSFADTISLLPNGAA